MCNRFWYEEAKKLGATLGAREREKKFNILEFQFLIYKPRLPLPHRYVH